MRRSNRRHLAVERFERRDAPSVSPAGSEFRVNTVTAGTQDEAAIALDADGDFVVAWVGSDACSDGVFAQRYGSNGAALGAEFLVNTFTAGAQSQPAVAASAAGDFVVVWASAAQDGSLAGVYGQRHSAAGVAAGSEFHVSQAASGNQNEPAVAMDAAGNFVVTWQSSDGDGTGVFARRYDANGTALGGEFRVNSFTAGGQQRPSVGMAASGDFVVAWQSADQDGSGLGVYAQRFAAGAPAGGEFRVNTFTANDQSLPSVACDPAGNFTIAWQSLNQGSATSGEDIIAQRYNAAGAAVGANVQVAGLANNESAPAVARDGKGDTVFTWTAGGTDIRLRTLSAGGGLSAESTANTTTTNLQAVPAVSCDAEGDFVIVWSGEGTGDAAGVFGQRYAESTDVVGPRVAGVYAAGIAGPVAESERLVVPPAALLAVFTEDTSVAGGAAGVNSVTNPANWSLTRNGAAVAVTSITYGFNGTTRRFEATLNLASPPLSAGTYVLTASANVRDLAGIALDGDGNGTPGGAFTRRFSVFAPVAAGPETRANQVTAGAQFNVQVAATPAGDFVAVWQSAAQDGSGLGVFARRYSAGGAALGGEFRVNTFTNGDQTNPEVAIDADGDFVVAWQSADQDGDGLGVYAQRYNSSGAAQGAEIRVNQVTADAQESPSVAMDAAGNFIVTWESNLQDGSGDGVFARRYSAAGVALSDEFPVNVVTSGGQQAPRVAADADGDFAVAWTDGSQDGGGRGVYARRFAADGVARGGEFRVNVTTANDQLARSVAMDAAGDFLIAWQSNGQDGSDVGVFARRYSAAGVAQTGEIAVNVTTLAEQSNPAAAMDADGDAVVTWQGDLQDGSGFGVFARRFDAAGAAVGGEFQVNTFTASTQGGAAAAVDGDGDFVIAWSSALQDSSSNGVYFQRYAAPPAPRVATVTANPGATDRSRVLSITVTFDAAVTFAGAVENAFGLSRIGGGAVGGFTATAATVNGVTVVTLSNFTGAETQFGSLADGRYTVLVRANQVSSGGSLLDGNGDGTGGDDFLLAGTVANGLYRLYGDVNADGVVNAFDFAQFRGAFGSAVGQAAYLAFLDLNGDGVINAFDFGQFRNHFGSTVP